MPSTNLIHAAPGSSLCRARKRHSMHLQVIPPQHPSRSAVSAFVRATYKGCYGAQLAQLPTRLCAHFDAQGQASCAAGLRSAEDGFFSETYLAGPVEQVLAEQTGLAVARQDVVEVSSLVSRDPRACLPFVTALIRHGASLGYGWTFFTATAHLSRLLLRLGLPLIDLGAAPVERVADPKTWGSYYDTNPRVFALQREQVLPVLEQRISQRAQVADGNRSGPRPIAVKRLRNTGFAKPYAARPEVAKPCPALAALQSKAAPAAPLEAAHV